MLFELKSVVYLPLFHIQDEPGPGQYEVKVPTKPRASKRPPFGLSAERSDRHSRRFFLGAVVSKCEFHSG